MSCSVEKLQKALLFLVLNSFRLVRMPVLMCLVPSFAPRAARENRQPKYINERGSVLHNIHPCCNSITSSGGKTETAIHPSSQHVAGSLLPLHLFLSIASTNQSVCRIYSICVLLALLRFHCCTFFAYSHTREHTHQNRQPLHRHSHMRQCAFLISIESRPNGR